MKNLGMSVVPCLNMQLCVRYVFLIIIYNIFEGNSKTCIICIKDQRVGKLTKRQMNIDDVSTAAKKVRKNVNKVTKQPMSYTLLTSDVSQNLNLKKKTASFIQQTKTCFISMIS